MMRGIITSVSRIIRVLIVMTKLAGVQFPRTSYMVVPPFTSLSESIVTFKRWTVQTCKRVNAEEKRYKQ